MHTHSISRWEHDHVFLGSAHERNERRLGLVIGLTLIMMVGEVVAGSVYGSMALLADGWHMATHAGALSISAIAYAIARRKARDRKFVFGTGKIGDLAGFTSAIILAGIAVLIGYQSFGRLVKPAPIGFDESILVAVLGLVVNAVCALLLSQGGSGHEHHGHHGHDAHGERAHPHEHERHASSHAHHDHNIRSAYLHVAADAVTSVLAIGALCAGKFLGWGWTDPLCGIVGALVILRWSFGLLRDTGSVLLDVDTAPELTSTIRDRVERDTRDRVADLHVWRVGPGHFAAIVSIVSDEPREPEHYKQQLRSVERIAHLTVEVQPCVAAVG